VNLPSAIQAYFDADSDTDGPAPTKVFATNAIVKDDGKTHVGREAIAEWWRAAKAKYQATSEPREISSAGERFTVLAEVRGKFAGSPTTLSFIFTLKDNAIVTLEIGA
jgi:hypothetical protein